MPIDNGSGGPTTISSSALQGCSGYQDAGHDYFFTESGDGATVMKAPSASNTDCPRTSGSQHCRTEFRETNPSSWSPAASTNRLHAELLGTAGASTCIGQVFQANSGYSKPIAELYYYDNGELHLGIARSEAGGGGQDLPLVGTVARGTRFSYDIHYEAKQLSISINGGDFQPMTLHFDSPGAYFKAGNYNQGDDAADVHFFALTTEH